MRKLLPLLVFVCLVTSSLSQTKNTPKTDTAKKAILQFHITNSAKKPLDKEEIIVSSANKKKTYRVITNELGNGSTSVDPGYLYIIELKTIGDTTTYGKIEIDALKPNEFYKEPFVLDMVYEPARSYTFHHLEFDIAKATVKTKSYKELDQLVEFMQRKTAVTIEIIGHTDNVGKDADNKKLSQQRADAVKSYLTQKGINATRMIVFGMGASQPIADNAAEEGRQKNRRTELKIL
jgi:outer membrane protein OmpA-like peptidoglycan-associated protein